MMISLGEDRGSLEQCSLAARTVHILRESLPFDEILDAYPFAKYSISDPLDALKNIKDMTLLIHGWRWRKNMHMLSHMWFQQRRMKNIMDIEEIG